MPLDEHDPHYALGLEHGQSGTEPYEFQDIENQRRYLTGYQCGSRERSQVSRQAMQVSYVAFNKLVERMQQQQDWTPSVWAPQRRIFPKP